MKPWRKSSLRRHERSFIFNVAQLNKFAERQQRIGATCQRCYISLCCPNCGQPEPESVLLRGVAL